MSIQKFRQKVSANKKITNPPVIPWVRNPSWVPMPAITSSDEEVAMLVPVYPQGTYIAFTFATSSGTYDVDWGDGTSDIGVTSNVSIQKLYDYTIVGLDNTNGPVTFTDSGDIVNRTSHGYIDGAIISFANIVTTTGISAGQIYYVVNATTDTFQVSATEDGTPLTLTSDGSGEILAYKQAVIRVTPNTGGATLTTVNLQVKNTTSGLQAYSQPILDLIISANCSTLIIGGQSTVPCRILERCQLLRHNTVNFSGLFSTCSNLRVVTIGTGPNVTNVSTMFYNCVSLVTAPIFDTSSATLMNGMFYGCSSLSSLPFYDTGLVNNMSTCFQNCYSLVTIPLFNLESCTRTDSMFSGCTSLVEIPRFNTPLLNRTDAMFYGCSSLFLVPLFDTSSVTNMTQMFYNCQSIVTVPLFDTSSVLTMNIMFSGCRSLMAVPPFNTSLVTTMATMFSNCNSLISVPQFNTASVTTFSAMFNGCYSLTYVPALNTSSASGTSAFPSMFNGCVSLSQVPDLNLNVATVTSSSGYSSMFSSCTSLSQIGKGTTNHGPKFTFSVASCKLSGEALDALYTSLPTVTGQSITVSNNVGTASDTPSIATGKGWTVTGS